MDVECTLGSYPSFSLDTHPSKFSIHADYPGLEEIEIEKEREELFHKNTESFKCFAQVIVSRSSLIFHPLYHFPPLEDPGIDEALNYEEPMVVYDEVGCTKYLEMCKQFAIVPISRICKNLPTKCLNLKFYGLTVQQIKAITEALRQNLNVEDLNLQDNWLPLESAACVAAMLENNNTIQVLNLRECRIGPEGANLLCEALTATQQLRDLDLSFNGLGDEGLLALKLGLKLNTSLKKLNVNNNMLTEKSAEVWENVLKENKNIEELDLSWNSYYTPAATKLIFSGLHKDEALKSLNLSWNGISEGRALRPLGKALSQSETMEVLDLSSNRLGGGSLKAARLAFNKSETIKVFKLGNNRVTPDEALVLVNLLVKKPQLEVLDLENIWMDKRCLPVLNKITKLEKTLIYGGIYSNYTIYGPDELKLIFNRCKYILQKAKKKKQRKDFGHFILKMPETPEPREKLEALLKKEKMKKLLNDKDLLNALFKRFPAKKGNIDVVGMTERYLSYFPDTQLPPPKPKKAKDKKGKKGKGKKGKKREVELEEGLKPEKTMEEGILEYLTSHKQDLTVSELDFLAQLEEYADEMEAIDAEDEEEDVEEKADDEEEEEQEDEGEQEELEEEEDMAEEEEDEEDEEEEGEEMEEEEDV